MYKLNFRMNKKLVIIGGIILVLLILAGGGIFLYQNQNKPVEQVSVPQVTQPASIVLAKEWKDPLGFSVNYPDFMNLDPHDEDKENYAHLEFTATPSAGRIIIWAEDPPPGTINEWIASDPVLKDGSIIDTNWGSVAAKKIGVKGENPKIVTAVLYDDLLWEMELYPDSAGKFAPAYDAMVTNFKFYPIPGSNVSGGSNSVSGGDNYNSDDSGADNSNVIYEDEEVVE